MTREEKQKQKLSKKKLSEKLKAKGMTVKGKYDDLRKAAELQGIPLFLEEVKAKERWQGKQKGLLQVLWECSFIDTTKMIKKHYTMSRMKNAFGITITETSLKYLMLNTCNFEEEEMLLQSMG